MPWIFSTPSPAETPEHYEWPKILGDNTVLGHNIKYAFEKRKEIGILREEMLGYQKKLGKIGNIEAARFFRDISSELMKQYRGWDCAIRLIDDGDWRHGHISKEIAPFVDMALNEMDVLG